MAASADAGVRERMRSHAGVREALATGTAPGPAAAVRASCPWDRRQIAPWPLGTPTRTGQAERARGAKENGVKSALPWREKSTRARGWSCLVLHATEC